MNDTQRKWLNAAVRFGGSFVKTFAQACFYADDENFKILEPALAQMIVKYLDYLTPPYQRELEDL